MRSFSVRYITKLTKSAASLLRASSTGMCTKEVSAAFRFIENLHCPCVNLSDWMSESDRGDPSEFFGYAFSQKFRTSVCRRPPLQVLMSEEALQGSNMQHAHSHFLPLRPSFERADYPKANKSFWEPIPPFLCLIFDSAL